MWSGRFLMLCKNSYCTILLIFLGPPCRKLPGAASQTHLWYCALNKYCIIIIIIVLSSWQSHCESSLGLQDKYSTGTKRPPTFEPSQLAWAAGLPILAASKPCPPFIIITQPDSWYSFYHPAEDRRLSRPWWLLYITRWFTCPQMVTHPRTNQG